MSEHTTNRPRELRTLHFDLSHTPPGAELNLHLGTGRHRVQCHDGETRTRFRAALPLLHQVPDESLTHFVEDLSFPSDAVQSYYITHPAAGPDALPRLSLIAIHVPRAALEGAVQRADSLFATKARRLGLTAADNPPMLPLHEPDLADYVDMSDAAKAIVFHHPEIICLDPGLAAQLLSVVEQTPAFQALVDCLDAQGRAQGPDSRYEGFSNGVYLTDHGEPILDQKGRRRWSYVHTDDTKRAMTPVVQQALLGIRNYRSKDGGTMEGKSFVTVYGKSNVMNAPAPGVLPAAHAANTTYKYKLDDPDWRSGRRLALTAEQRRLKITVENCYFRYLSIFARFLRYDADGNLVPLGLTEAIPGYAPKVQDGPFTQYLGKVDDRARFMGIPTEQQAEFEFELELPEKANAVDILCGGIGTGAFDDAYEFAYYPGALLTGVLDLGIPAFFLAFGVGSGKLEMPKAKKLLKNLATWIVETFVGIIDRAALFGAGYTPDRMGTGSYNMHADAQGVNRSVLGYSFRGKSPGLRQCQSGGGASSPLSTMQNIELDPGQPDALLKVLRCGFAAPIMVAYDLLAPATGGHFIVARAGDGESSQYHVRKLDLRACEKTSHPARSAGVGVK